MKADIRYQISDIRDQNAEMGHMLFYSLLWYLSDLICNKIENIKIQCFTP